MVDPDVLVGTDDVLAVLDAAVALLDTLDVDRLGDAALDRLVVGGLIAEQRLRARLASSLRRWDDRGVWAMDGSRSPAYHLSRRTHSDPRTMRRRLRLAHAAGEMPFVEAAWRDGALCDDDVAVFGEARGQGRDGVFAEHEEVLVTECVGLRFPHAVRAVEYWKQRADAIVNPDGPAPIDVGVTVSATFRGVVHVNATLDAIGGAAFSEALARIERELWRDDLRDGVERTLRERNAEALVEMAMRACASRPGSRRPEPLVLIVAGQQSMARICELGNGQIVAPDLVVPHLSHCDIQTLVFDNADRAVSTSPQRTFTGALRRVIQTRDRHCQHPSGCDQPITRCDVDHAIPRCQGGATSQDNGRLLCEKHNRNLELRDRAPGDNDHGNHPANGPPDGSGGS